MLADSARLLAQLVVDREHVFDDASFDELVGSKLDVVAPANVRWNHWEDGCEVSELRTLYEKIKRYGLS